MSGAASVEDGDRARNRGGSRDQRCRDHHSPATGVEALVALREQRVACRRGDFLRISRYGPKRRFQRAAGAHRAHVGQRARMRRRERCDSGVARPQRVDPREGRRRRRSGKSRKEARLVRHRRWAESNSASTRPQDRAQHRGHTGRPSARGAATLRETPVAIDGRAANPEPAPVSSYAPAAEEMALEDLRVRCPALPDEQSPGRDRDSRGPHPARRAERSAASGTRCGPRLSARLREWVGEHGAKCAPPARRKERGR